MLTGHQKNNNLATLIMQNLNKNLNYSYNVFETKHFSYKMAQSKSA